MGLSGTGARGHAHALSLNDSGVDVVVGLYEGSASWPKAEEAGLRVATVSELAQQADMVMMLVPDHLQSRIYRESIQPHMGEGKTLMFAHGFNIHYGQIAPSPQIDVTMVAPKAPGHRMREIFTLGSGVPGPACHTSGRFRRRQRAGPSLRQGRRLHTGRRAGDHLQGGDGDRPLW